MGDSKWKTINKAKLEASIDALSSAYDAMTGWRADTRDTALAVKVARVGATHDALVHVLNSLD